MIRLLVLVIFAPGGADLGGTGAVGAARFAEILFKVPFVDGIGGGPGFAGCCILGGAGRDGAAAPDESNFVVVVSLEVVVLAVLLVLLLFR